MISPASAKPGSTVQVSAVAASMRGREFAAGDDGFCMPGYGELSGRLASRQSQDRFAALRQTSDNNLSVAPVGRLADASPKLVGVPRGETDICRMNQQRKRSTRSLRATRWGSGTRPQLEHRWADEQEF
jgi:hypothetical protein